MNVTEDFHNSAIVIDTGALIELLEDSKLGKILSEKVLQNPEIERYYISFLTDTELKYIFCRRNGYEEAKEIV